MKLHTLTILAALTIAGCGATSDDRIPRGSYSLAMTFQGAELSGSVNVAGDDGTGLWHASNAENEYGGHVISHEAETVWWFWSEPAPAAFQLHTVGGISIDPAIDATMVLAPRAQ